MQEMLYKKYRPQDFDNFFGNIHVITTIKNSILRNKISHAYMFSGPRGTGKTSLARLIAKSLSCLNIKDGFNPCNECKNCKSLALSRFPDMIEMDAASNRGIEEVRSLKDSVNYKPLLGKYKFYIIDEVHMLTKEAFNALLKTLEEPPKHVIFILATTEPEKVLDTIKSRCERHDLKLLDSQSIYTRLKDIINRENREIDDESLELLIKESGSSMRDALSILEKVLTFFSEGKITLKDSEEALGVIPSNIIEHFYRSYLKKDLNALIETIDKSWKDGYKIESLLKDLAFMILKDCEKSRNYSNINEVSKIYSSINEFRFEENKRAVGYVTVSRLLPIEKVDIKEVKVTEVKQNKEIEKIEVKEEKVQLQQEEERVELLKVVTKEKEVEVKQDSSVKSENVEIDKPEVKLEEIKAKEDKVLKLEVKEIKPKKEAIEDKALFSLIKEKWQDFLANVKEESISVMIFLLNGEVSSLENDILTLTYDSEHTFHRDSLMKTENRLILEGALHKMFDRNISLNIILKKEDKNSSFKDKVSRFLEEAN